MPIQNSPPARQTTSQARSQADLTPTSSAPLDGTPAIPQLRGQLDRGPITEGEAPSRKEGREPIRSTSLSGVVGRFAGVSRTTFKGPGEDGEEEENSVEEEGSDGTEDVPAPVGAFQGTGGPNLAQYNQPVSHQSEPSSLAIMQKMTQIMANLQEASSSDSSRALAFKNPSMKEPECFDGTQPFKVRSFIQSFQLFFHNYWANFSQDKKKVLYATSFLIGRAEKWIESYLPNLTNQDPKYLLNSWKLFESKLFTLFGDPNEVQKTEAELDSLRMKEGVHVLLYIADFRNLVSIIGDWGGRSIIHHFRKGFPSRNLDWLDSHPSGIESLQELMDVTLELNTKYHERQKEKTLVGDSRISSFPSSVHIPSLDSHMSLLSSRDKVFQEIQDVREDNSVSSLHLFFGDMKLPPSSYHDSLEEFWDGKEHPEEVETVMKVVPSVYHQYLDVFSKVKEAKITPHYGCDNHIQLEGSLPPFEVIYSLSDQESDILRAYISDNLEKRFHLAKLLFNRSTRSFCQKEGWWPQFVC
ncbi:hypothetical protein O181_018595 [Austropuccinia psidii MF-1]|uniref:Retrotransposon gag domain-containing protein n=1 Tax=Austropuccinia psidii MF-1 TaxID=1389203 RepID=A0A9Q3C910_9BASI|nr:hypothetical protein [Austropuccinia psidii MF-1]